MKKLFVLPIIFSMSLFILSCEDTTTGPDGTSTTTGNLYIQSTPAGAQIWYVKGTTGTPVNSGKVAPDTLKSLDVSTYTIVLKLDGYKDSTFTINVTAGQTTSRAVLLSSNLLSFAGTQIWESLAPNPATQPSGLILKNGSASGIGTSSTNRLIVDIYYSSTIYNLRSAHNYGSGLTRQTFFKAGSSNNMNDGLDATVKDGTWISDLPAGSDRDSTKYYFVYDQDKHYSKIKVVGWGGGTGGTDYAWTRIQIIYNSDIDDVRF